MAVAGLLSVPFLRTNRATVSPGIAQKTVAVLPFENVNGDAATDYLRLALADQVATALSWTPSLAVRPMAASRRFVGSGTSPQQAGQQLRVGEIVTGHFSTHQSELRVTVEAVEVDGNRLPWRNSVAAGVGHRDTHCHPGATEKRRRLRGLPQEPRELERPGTKPGSDCDARARERDRP